MKSKNEIFTLLDKPCDPNAQLSREELYQLDFLFSNEQEDECITQWMQRDWEENPEGFDYMNYEYVFDRVKRQVETNRSKRLSFIQFFYRCAAVFLFPFIGLSIYFFMQTNNLSRSANVEIVEILDPSGTQAKITLSDGSIVTLKDGSQINQKNNFNGKTREIEFEGEASFDIVDNPYKPFIIHTGRIRTTVLGTSFSIKAVPGDNSITVTVAEGKVKVEDGFELLATLEANQQFIHGIETEYLQKKAINVEHNTGWQLHELIFSNMPFGDIVKELTVRYGVSIVFENEELKQRRITALLDNRDSVDAMLKLLCATHQASYTVEGKKYTIK